MQRVITTTMVLAVASLISISAGAAPSSPGCTSAESRQFDFWVGKWDVSPKGADKVVAHSLIEKLYNGCAVRENWMPNNPANSGGSLNAFDTTSKTWRQFWMDSSGSIALFEGAWNGKALVIQGEWGGTPEAPHRITRMAYTPLPDGSVEQAGDTSDDGGKTWQPSFDLIYRRSAA